MGKLLETICCLHARCIIASTVLSLIETSPRDTINQVVADYCDQFIAEFPPNTKLSLKQKLNPDDANKVNESLVKINTLLVTIYNKIKVYREFMND